MNTGMLWLMNNRKPVEACVLEAIAYYEKKYGRVPDAAFVNPGMLNGRDVTVRGISVSPLRSVLPFHLWIGVEDEHASQQLPKTAEETGCAWDDVSSDDFDGCAGCAGACGFKTRVAL